MRRTSFEQVNCSVAQCLEVIGEWWTMLIVRDIFLGVTRFDDICARLGISRNVLTDRLEHLVDHGVIERQPYQDHPVRYDYRLTAKGRDLWPVIDAMREWGDRYAAPDGPRLELIHRGCGHHTHAVLSCSECGEPLDSTNVKAVPGPASSGLFPPDEIRHRPTVVSGSPVPSGDR
jgi:DNA-binding HxlR family transcriptional regulator